MVPSIHIQHFTIACNSSARRSITLFWSPWAVHKNGTHKQKLILKNKKCTYLECQDLKGGSLGKSQNTKEGQNGFRIQDLTVSSLCSILKKVYTPVQERVTFPGKGSWPHLSLEPIGELAPMPITGVDTMDILNTGEKIFVFKSPKEPEISLRVPPRRKKNFLNAKKASRALGLD